MLFYLIFLLFFNTITLNAKNINFFINYDVITFSTFNDFVEFNSQNNITQYIQYNSIIPIFLSWDNPDAIVNIKNLAQNKKLFVFDYKKNIIKNKQLAWFIAEKENIKKKIFKNIISSPPIIIKKQTDKLNVLNFIELDKILSNMTNKNSKRDVTLYLSSSLFLYNKINQYFQLIKKYKNSNLEINIYIYGDKEYRANKKDIHKFIDMLYTLKMNKILSYAENKIYRLSLNLFIFKLQNSLTDIMLNLFPLSNSLQRRYFISSMEFTLNNKRYITLYDKKNFFIFSDNTGYLKKFFYYKKGESLINFDSLVDEIYIRNLREKNYHQIRLSNKKYIKFSNGLSFNLYNPEERINVEKNIILQYDRLLISYKIKNNGRKKKKFYFVIKNKFSPSLNYIITTLKNRYAIYDKRKKRATYKLNKNAAGIINCDTGYGIRITSYNPINGMEVFKGLYYYNYNLYFKFYLYPFEEKILTINLKRIYINPRKLKKDILKNMYWGQYEIK